MSSLIAMFGSSQEKTQGDSEKLLDLYWNRAELKKEFAGMRDEQFNLQDQIKQKDGAAARLQQKLDHIEGLLVDPDWAYNVIVFYQFRGLALRCHNKLATFAEQLKQQQEQRRHNRQLVAWNEERTREACVFESQVSERRATIQQLEDQQQAERRRLSSMSGFLKIFKRRSISATLASLGDQIAVAQDEEENLLHSIEEIHNKTPPDNEGLDIATKRSINLMIIAFSQHLYLHVSDDELALMAKESSEKSVGATKYGSRIDCKELLSRIDKVMELLEQGTELAEVLQHRSKLLGEKATFGNDTDAVPTSGTVGTLFEIDKNGLIRERELNMLGENWWGISKVLSR